jgi:uncharacterized protein (TIGR03083 family)
VLGDSLDEAEWKTPSELPGWTVQDNLSHIIGTERMMQGHPTPQNQPARTDHLHNPVGEMNEHWVEDLRSRSGAQVLDVFRQVGDERLAELSALPPEAFDEIGPTPVGQAPFREFVAVRIMDSWIHEQDMRRPLGRLGHRHGPEVDLSVDRLVKALPYVVGKQVGAPDGTSVVVTVTTPADSPDEAPAAPRVIAVVVEGRAGLVEVVPDHPTATLDLDLDAFVALTTGRWAPATALAEGRVSLGGDADLARQVLEHLSFMV